MIHLKTEGRGGKKPWAKQCGNPLLAWLAVKGYKFQEFGKETGQREKTSDLTP